MRKFSLRITFLLFLYFSGIFSNCVVGQANKGLESSFKKHISLLAADSLEGRETGKPGEEKAYRYIIKQFSEIGLKPKGENGKWLQEFEFTSARVIKGENDFTTISKATASSKEFSDKCFPVNLSANGTATGEVVNVGFGITSPENNYDDYAGKVNLAGKIFLINISSPDGIHPHSKYIAHSDIRTKVILAEKKGAAGVIFVNSDSTLDEPKIDSTRKPVRENIPVYFVKGDSWKNLVGNKVSMTANLVDVKVTGHNVCGMIDNGAPYTIILGAHYDHLGWGNESSLYKGEPAIHNGADDNASGTAMIIELARYLKAKGNRNYNYLFLSFSGEELGLFGSKNFTDHPLVDLSKVSYMLNFDMVGRMDSIEHKIEISGVGTSPSWKYLDSVKVENLSIKKSESGVGPSDHTSFYRKDIPVLHFFSGTHSDYHKPSDDEFKINYPGMTDIYSFVIQLMEKLNNSGKLEFTKTKESDTENTKRSFTVTLGIVPDYMYEGSGLKVDGVTEGKPAFAAGVKTGDIIEALGDYQVTDMKAYMKALGGFVKGDKTKVKVKRGTEELLLDVQF